MSLMLCSDGLILRKLDYVTVSKGMNNLKVRYQKKISRATNNGTGIVMLIDNSDFKVFGEGEWILRKHGTTYRRTWRETRIALDHETRDIIGFINTTVHIRGNTQLNHY